MARPVKNTVDYFPHYCNHGKTIFILEKQFGNNGYAIWFKTLELLANTKNHYIDLRDESFWEFFVAKMGVSGTETKNVLILLSKLGAIDKELWQKRVIWSENFIKNISDAYKKRGQEIPPKPVIGTETAISDTETPISCHDNTQSKVDNTILNNSKKNILAANAAREIFNYNTTLENWIKGNNKMYSLIGKFFRYKKLIFETREQMNAAAKRHLRAAKDLQFFTNEQIDESLSKITQKENLKDEFTLDTILKYITK